MGALVGTYLPLNYLARNGDCFSNTWYTAETILSYHSYFDGKGVPTDPLGLTVFLFNVLNDAYTVASGLVVCFKQSHKAHYLNWIAYFASTPSANIKKSDW